MSEYDDMIQYWSEDHKVPYIDGEYIVLQDLDAISKMVSEDRIGWQFWLLLPDGTTVAYIKVWYDPTKFDTLLLNEIEVREEYRGNSYSRALVEYVQAVSGRHIYATGDFTQDGYAKLRSWIPIAGSKHPKPTFRDQNFVTDWDTLETPF